MDDLDRELDRYRSKLDAPPSADRLAELEGVIERGLANFLEVGRALTEIRDSKLYREAHPTFEAYCRERWHFSARRAYQLMEAERTARANANHGSQKQAENERQARAIAHPPKPKPIELPPSAGAISAPPPAEGVGALPIPADRASAQFATRHICRCSVCGRVMPNEEEPE